MLIGPTRPVSRLVLFEHLASQIPIARGHQAATFRTSRGHRASPFHRSRSSSRALRVARTSRKAPLRHPFESTPFLIDARANRPGGGTTTRGTRGRNELREAPPEPRVEGAAARRRNLKDLTGWRDAERQRSSWAAGLTTAVPRMAA